MKEKCGKDFIKSGNNLRMYRAEVNTFKSSGFWVLQALVRVIPLRLFK
jgi:hypothetical protein